MNVEQAIHKRVFYLCQERNYSFEELSQILDSNEETTIDDVELICNKLKISLADFFCSDLFRKLD